MIDNNQVSSGNINTDLRFNLSANPLYNNVFSEVFDEMRIDCKYYDEAEIPQLINSLDYDAITCIGLNIQSLASKFTEFKNMIDNINTGRSQIAFFCLQEHWLHNNNTDFYNIEGYKSFFKCRENGRGGGVGIFARKDISCELISNNFFLNNIFESISLKVKYNNFRALVVSLYRPPSHPTLSNAQALHQFNEILNDFLTYLEDFNLPIIFTGDLNINQFCLGENNNGYNELMETLIANGYIQTIMRATRIALPSFSLIDLFCIKNLLPTFSGVICNDVSDHFPIFNIFKVSNLNVKKPPSKKARIMSKRNIENFKIALNRQNWQPVLDSNETNQSYEIFLKTFLNLLNEHIPEKIIKTNKNKNPLNSFMTHSILKCRKKKLVLAKRSKRSLAARGIYILYRNTYNKLIKTAKKLNYRERIVKAKGNGKKVWEVIKDTMGKKKENDSINKIIVNNTEITDSTKIANEFNLHFRDLGPNLCPSIPKTEVNFKDYLPPRNPNSFFFHPLIPADIRKYILSFKPKKSIDDNSISMFLLKKVAEEISGPLCHVFNLSLLNGKLPNLMKISRTLPIFKGGLAYLLDNYRGVSLICNFSKILEKIVYDRLFKFLNDNNILNKMQFGFRSGVSTTHAILNMVNMITDSLASGGMALAVLLDVRKCFDLIDRDILMVKLENYGVRGVALDWFRDYFTNRKQRVHVNGFVSEFLCDIDLGVLQGSILGIILFLCFINDIFYCSNEINSNLFCDDNGCLIKARTFNELIAKCTTELPKLISWYCANRLLIHPQKTKGILYTSPRSRINLDLINKRINFPVALDMNNYDENLPENITPLDMIPNQKEDSTKLLGLMLDNKLNWKPHFKKMYAKVAKAVYSLAQMKNILDKAHLKLLYNSYVKSNLQYGSCFFFMASAHVRAPIFKLQKQSIRTICGVGHLAHTAELFREERILPFDQLIRYNIIKLMFHYKAGKLPEIFNGFWKLNSEVHNLNLRNQHDFHIPNFPAVYLSNHPRYKFAAEYNSIPESLKSINNEKQFLKGLFNFLLTTINH